MTVVLVLVTVALVCFMTVALLLCLRIPIFLKVTIVRLLLRIALRRRLLKVRSFDSIIPFYFLARTPLLSRPRLSHLRHFCRRLSRLRFNPDIRRRFIPAHCKTVYLHLQWLDSNAFQEDIDWTNVDQLVPVAIAQPGITIWINGIALTGVDDESRDWFGHLFTGDIVEFFHDSGPGPKSFYQLRCEFNHGPGSGPRKKGFVVEEFRDQKPTSG